MPRLHLAVSIAIAAEMQAICARRGMEGAFALAGAPDLVTTLPSATPSPGHHQHQHPLT